MRYLFSGIAILILAINVKAQKWTEMMKDPNANFYDIVKEFDNYWKDRPYERGKGYKAFKRWQWFAEPRVYPSGNLKYASMSYAQEEYNKFLATNPSAKLTGPNALVSATTANWVPLGPFGSPAGGDAGRVQVIRMHPAGTNTFYVGTGAGGFWMTNNGGVSYTTTTDQLGSCGVSDIAIPSQSPNIIYIATGDKDAGDTHSIGIMKSTDGGQTWSATGLVWQVSQQRRIYRLLVNPQNPDILIAATTDGMYKTTNAGQTWTQTVAGVFVDAEFKPGDPNVVHVVTGSNYMRSNDGGNTFSVYNIANNLNSNRLSLAVTPANASYVYILVSATNNGFGGLFRSSNEGNTFTLRSSTPNIFDWSTNGSGTGGQGWYDIAIDASPTNAEEIIAGGVNTWKSTNGGTSWILNSHWYGGGGKPYVHADLHHVLYVNGTTCFLGTDGGVARTTNSGTNWTTINGNMNIAQMYRLGLSASNPGRIVTGHQDNGTNLSNGTSWSEIYGGDGMDCFIDWNNNNVIIASYVYGDFQRSTNGGGIWTNITNGLTGNGAWLSPIVQSPSSPNTYYCGYQQVFRTTNQGTSWTQMGNIGVTIDEIKISPSNTNIIYAVASNAVFKTTNGGTTWSNITNNLNINLAFITDLAIDNQNPNNIYVTLSGYSAGNKVYKSINGGGVWSNYSNGLPNIPVNCIVYKNNSNQAVYVGTDMGVYYKEASMPAWIPYNNGLPNIVVSDMEIYYPTGKLRAATYARGVWETDIYSDPLSPPVSAFSIPFSDGCVNLPLQFTDVSGNNPNAWNWTFGGGSPGTSTVQNPTATFTAAGIYTVTLITSNGNGTSTPYQSTISVVNVPTVSPVSNSICAGLSAQVGVNTNGNLVDWSTGQQGTSISVTNSVTTLYNFTVSLGACKVTGNTTLTVMPNVTQPQIVIVGSDLTTTLVGVTYQWYLNGNSIPGATLSVYTPTQAGWYSVWVDNGGCKSSSSPVEITDVGIQEMQLFSSMLLGPVPAKDILILSMSNELRSKDIGYEIHNVSGQMVKKGLIRSGKNSSAEIDLHGISTGVYILKLYGSENSHSVKFVKQ